MKKSLRLEDLEVYKVAIEIGEMVWNVVMQWDFFAKKTLGCQFVDAADSIAFNISEGYGRYHYKENKNFCYYCRGSAKETLTAVHKAISRKLISQNDADCLQQKLDRYFRLMFGYINSIGKKGDEDN